MRNDRLYVNDIRAIDIAGNIWGRGTWFHYGVGQTCHGLNKYTEYQSIGPTLIMHTIIGRVIQFKLLGRGVGWRGNNQLINFRKRTERSDCNCYRCLNKFRPFLLLLNLYFFLFVYDIYAEHLFTGDDAASAYLNFFSTDIK